MYIEFTFINVLKYFSFNCAGLWTSGANVPCTKFYSYNYSVLDDKLIICGKQIATYIPSNSQSVCNFREDIESYGK